MSEMLEKGFWHEVLVQMSPVGEHIEVEAQRPSKMALSWHDLQRRVKRAASWKRTLSGIWDSSGNISAFCWLLLPDVLIWYFLVSRPRHSASRTESVPGIGAHRRSIGGKICFNK